MSYPAPKYFDHGEISAVLRRAGQPPDLAMGEGSRLHYLATGRATGGMFGLYLCEFLGPRSGADPHFHTTLSESFYVLSGKIQLHDGRGWVDGMPGDWMFVPEGGIHGFRNQSGAPASMLLLFAPGAPREPFFEGFAELATGRWRPGGKELADFMRQHDNHMLRPPLS